MKQDLHRTQAYGARMLFLRTTPRLVKLAGPASNIFVPADAGPPRALIRPIQHAMHSRQELLAMTGNHTTLIHSIAHQRTQELRAEAQRDRFFAELGRQNGVPTPIDRVRQAVGGALVRAGNLVGGDRGERQQSERIAGAPALRIAR